MASIIQLRRDTAANWTSADPVLAQGELGIETDTGAQKIGDGATLWSNLSYNTLNLQGNTVIESDVQLTGSTADGFPNTTTLYIWNFDSTSSESQTDIIGSKALLVAAGALTAGNDVLGNSKYCAFDGSTYLSSDDAAFNFIGDFSIGGWVYLANWADGATHTLFTRYTTTGASNGWGIDKLTTNQLRFFTYSTTLTSNFRVDCSGLSAGWHHVVFLRDADVGASCYIDGVCVGVNADAAQAITAGGNLEIGAKNGGSDLLTGRIDELFVYKDTILTADQVRNIYARSAKKFAVKAQDNTVSVFNPHADETHLASVIDVVQVGNIGIADNDTDILKFNFTPKKIVLNFSGIAYKDINYQGHGTGSCVITITGTDTFTSVLNRNSSFLASGAFSTDVAAGDTTNVIYIKAGGTYFVGTAVWNTAAKTLTITYQETNTTTASNGIDITAVAYK